MEYLCPDVCSNSSFFSSFGTRSWSFYCPLGWNEFLELSGMCPKTFVVTKKAKREGQFLLFPLIPLRLSLVPDVIVFIRVQVDGQWIIPSLFFSSVTSALPGDFFLKRRWGGDEICGKLKVRGGWPKKHLSRKYWRCILIRFCITDHMAAFN